MVVQPHAAHVPFSRTPLVGRARETAQIQQLLLRVDVPLLTLTGVGGVGKTRLASEVAGSVIERFPDGTWFVELAGIRDSNLVAHAVAQALGVTGASNRTPNSELKAFLGPREILLVLDNFEHVIDAATVVGDLLATCRGLKILATSRTPLRISGEHEYRVPPLALPDPEGTRVSLDELNESGAVALFLHRVSSVSPEFALTEENASTIVAICHQLDGLPLALELAAARGRMLPLPALLARLTNRLLLLTQGARDQPLRFQSMRDAIAWSYDLLAPEHQTLFRRLSVFAGGFTLEAAEAIASRPDDKSTERLVDTTVVLDGVAALVDQSLVERKTGDERNLRFGMLETIREFASELLHRTDETDAVHKAHADYMLKFAEEADGHVHGGDQFAWLRRVDDERDNVRIALTWLIERNETAAALRLAVAMQWFWLLQTHWSEGRTWLEAVLAMPGAEEQSHAIAMALAGVSSLAFHQSDYATTRVRSDESVAISRKTGDKRALAFALVCRGLLSHVEGQHDLHRALASESLELYRALNDEWGIVSAACSLGIALVELEDPTAESLFHESLERGLKLGDAWGTARALNCLGEVARIAGTDEIAMRHYEEALTLFRRLKHKKRAAQALHNMGYIAAHGHDHQKAAALFAEGFALQAEERDYRTMSMCLIGLGAMLSQFGELEQATRLIGAALRLATERGVVYESIDRAEHEHSIAAIRTRLGPARFEELLEEGRRLTIDQVIADATAASAVIATRPEQVPVAPIGGAIVDLTTREREVLRLLVEGHSNPEIAATLFISHKTASKHVTNILAKFGVESRTAAATYAVRHGFL